MKSLSFLAGRTLDVIYFSLLQMSEDCLYLNIYTPRDADESSGYAVMLFLHGGSFEFSSGGADVYNGETFVNKGEVILVTTNYRLGKNNIC